MVFINDFPGDEDIEKYNLINYKNNNDRPLESRFEWTVDRDRNFYLWGGLSGNPQFDEEMKGKFRLYLNGC